ncbi:MAG: AMP-dependent synthetase/ligase [Kiritimatiellia bacterium]|nr:AMP-dependent synthetase/ligase [Kiritimatiellia bacterium]
MTLVSMLEESAAAFASRVALRFKEENHWRTLSYADLLAEVQNCAASLRAEGVQSGDRVALLLENSPDWPVTYFGVVALGAIVVPVDPLLQAEEVLHILRDAGVSLVLCGQRQGPLLTQSPAAEGPWKIRVLDADSDPSAPPTIRLLRRLPAEKELNIVADPLDSARPASLIYTSGTTGKSKGVVLSHGNFLANGRSCLEAIRIRPDDRFLLCLPLHHAFAFLANLILPLMAGAEICIAESMKKLGDNLSEVSPTALLGVPLLYDKLCRRLETSIRERPVARILWRWGFRRPVRSAIRKKLGGRLRLAVTGGAPCDADTIRKMESFGIPLIEGYGLTEAGPVVTLNPPEAPRAGSVGRPLPGIEVRLLNPDASGVGELAVRGANVMSGYYQNPEATRETLTEGGWLRTGDLARIEADGYLAIRGRKKALIVNREGKNIYPEEVERQIQRSPLVLECIVAGYRQEGESGERIGAIIVPDPDALAACASPGETLSETEIGDRVRADVRRVLRDIAEYKRPRRLEIRMTPFEKTSTQKIRRHLYRLS